MSRHQADGHKGNMKRLLILVSVALVSFVTSSSLSATSASGTVAVTATVVASVSLTFSSDGAGIALGSSGTSAATVAFGSVQAYGGSVPSGVTRTVSGSTNWSLSTPIDV